VNADECLVYSFSHFRLSVQVKFELPAKFAAAAAKNCQNVFFLSRHVASSIPH
jgi:hypothetical protein